MKNILKCCLLKFLPSMLSIKPCYNQNCYNEPCHKEVPCVLILSDQLFFQETPPTEDPEEVSRRGNDSLSTVFTLTYCRVNKLPNTLYIGRV